MDNSNAIDTTAVISDTGAQNTEAQDMESPFKYISVIGLGLIGSSLAGALKKAYPDVHIFGVDTDSRSCVVAQKRGYIDEYAICGDNRILEAFSNEADLIILAIPVAEVDGYLHLIADSGFNGVVTDTISTKAHILQAASDILGDFTGYIPGHPMAGSEVNGIDGARTDLFEGSNWILCPDSRTDPDQFSKLHELICGISARVVSIPREEHDSAVAIVSHVPHVIASALMRLANNHATDDKSLMRLAAGGFKDTTRIAAGSPKLWCGIAFDNEKALVDGLNEIKGIIGAYVDALESQDRQTLTSLLAESAEARNQLPAEWVPCSEKLLDVRIPMVNKNGVIAEVTTIASSVGCNIQSIEIDHLSEGNAVLSMILTDEGDIGQLSYQLIDAGYAVSFRPIEPKEHSHV